MLLNSHATRIVVEVQKSIIGFFRLHIIERLPWRTHFNILYSLWNKWPIEEKICIRSLLFGLRCITSESSVVRYVSRFGIKYGLMHSVLGRNILFGCQRCGIKVLDYFCMRHFSFHSNSFCKLYNSMNYNNSNVDFCIFNSLNECILLRDHQLSCSGLGISQITCIISSLCCSWVGLLDYLLIMLFTYTNVKFILLSITAVVWRNK